ncbi:MAG: glycosyltransferase [Candidatus Moraniibacteriota bacterium]
MKCAILISLYNAEKTLDKTFESLLAQTFQDFRIVAIDDASSDATQSRLMVWQLRFGPERFRLIKNGLNLGLTKSLNAGLAVITEPYTGRIDADDWWHPEKLARQLTYLDTHADCGLVGSFYENISSRGSKRISLPETDVEIRKNIFKRNPFAHSCVLFRTDIVKRLGGYDETIRYGQDYDLWLRLLPETMLANIPDVLCSRTTEGTLTARRQREQMLQCVKTQLKYLQRYRRPITEYRFIIEPLAVALTPEWLRRLKRKYLA